MKPHRTVSLNNITVPLAVELKFQAIRITQIQDDCTRILDADETFIKSRRQLRIQFTAGVVPKHTFKSVTQWLVGAALRRAGLPLNVARCYSHLTQLA